MKRHKPWTQSTDLPTDPSNFPAAPATTDDRTDISERYVHVLVDEVSQTCSLVVEILHQVDNVPVCEVLEKGTTPIFQLRFGLLDGDRGVGVVARNYHRSSLIQLHEWVE